MRPQTEGLPSPLGGRIRWRHLFCRKRTQCGAGGMCFGFHTRLRVTFRPAAGLGKVLVFPKAEQLLVRWTRRPRRPSGPGKLRGVAIST